ncbi:MAG: helix-turn-helix transcriptional regulator [Lachnospiraceae bacterium]|nr:helix-turn-helix transcriptional regulator [Lachnospiraceae bacterium]
MVESRTIIDMEETGNKLRRYVTACGYSVKDIQYYLGLSCPQPVYRWYKGDNLPSVDNLLRLSELFHVHMEDLLAKRNETDDVRYSIIVEDEGFLKRMQVYYTKLAV